MRAEDDTATLRRYIPVPSKPSLDDATTRIGIYTQVSVVLFLLALGQNGVEFWRDPWYLFGTASVFTVAGLLYALRPAGGGDVDC